MLKMSDIKAGKKVSFKNGSCTIESVFNKKSMFTTVYFKFKTSQDSLLNLLLQKYISDKVLVDGVNTVNDIMSAYATSNGMVIMCTERKIITNIITVYGYLMKTNLSSQESKCIKNGDYNTLHKDCMHFNVYIVGKCKNFNRVLTNSDDKKLERMVDSFENLPIKNDIPDIETPHDKVMSLGNSTDIDIDGRELFDLCVFMKDIPFIIDSKKIIPMSSDCCCRMSEKLFRSSSIQNVLKSWLLQSGSVGKPSANDAGGKKYKEKITNILTVMNAYTFVYSDIHNIKFKYSSIDDITSVNKDSAKHIRGLHIKCSC